MIPYEWTSSAHGQLHRLPRPIQRQILKKLEWYVAAPDPLHFAEPLVGREGRVYRFRVTDYRVIFEVAKGKLVITAVGRRDRIYE